MNKLFTLRSLTIFSFVIFFLPFMNTCSSYPLQEVPIEDAVEISKDDVGYTMDEDIEEINPESDSDRACNFYTLSSLILKDLKNLKLDDFSDKSFYPLLGFTIILFLSILILFFSFKNNFKIIYLLSSANLLILLISTLILCLTGIIEEINQIKIGYYLFVLNSIAILYFSKKLQKEKETQKE